MAVQIDIVRDFAGILRKRLAKAGYGSKPGEAGDVTIRRYLNLLNRSVEPCPRKTRMPKGFSCPQELQAGLDALLKESEAGQDLRPRQSRKIVKADYDDGILSDWGIHHFHLGTKPSPKDSRLIEGTGPVLYAYVTQDTLYGLGIENHGAWSNQRLLDTMHENYPELTAPYILKEMFLDPTVGPQTDEEIGEERKAGITTITQRPDGTVMMPPGGGVTTGKNVGEQSTKVWMETSKLLSNLHKMENELRLAWADRAGGPVNIQIIEENGEFVAVDWRTGRRHSLGEVVRVIDPL